MSTSTTTSASRWRTHDRPAHARTLARALHARVLERAPDVRHWTDLEEWASDASFEKFGEAHLRRFDGGTTTTTVPRTFKHATVRFRALVRKSYEEMYGGGEDAAAADDDDDNDGALSVLSDAGKTPTSTAATDEKETKTVPGANVESPEPWTTRLVRWRRACAALNLALAILACAFLAGVYWCDVCAEVGGAN